MAGQPARPAARAAGKFYRNLRAGLIAHAEAIYRLDQPGKDGATLRQHLAVVWRATGRRPAELDTPPLPTAASHLWDWYGDLSAARGNNGFSHNPIGWADLAAWQQVCGVALTPWEAETLIHLDRAVRAVLTKD